MSLPTISVVITCYNYARYVGDAIRSATEQGYPNLELVVVNDGSTDDSLSVIRRTVPVARVIDQANAGHIAALNVGFTACSGELVLFLDADDLLLPGSLHKIAANWRSSLVKVQYDLKIIDADSNDLGRRSCYFTSAYTVERVGEDFRRTGTYRWPVTTGNAYSRWYLELMFPLRAALPDGDLNTVAPVYGDIMTIPEALASYRIHGFNQWAGTGRDESKLQERIAVRQKEFQLMREHAARLQVALPQTDPMDHELAFLNYRMLALKLGHDYPGREHDSVSRLLHLAVRLLLRDDYPRATAMGHLLWFLALAAGGRGTASWLYRCRMQRADLKRRLRLGLSLPRGTHGNEG